MKHLYICKSTHIMWLLHVLSHILLLPSACLSYPHIPTSRTPIPIISFPYTHAHIPILPSSILSSQINKVLVLQIQRVKNVAMPSSRQHETNPPKRLLRVFLTDGHTSHSAVELDSYIDNLRCVCVTVCLCVHVCVVSVSLLSICRRVCVCT